jgi:hypothetical protein
MSRTPSLSAMSTTSPLSISMRATSTPAGKRPPPLLRTSSTSRAAPPARSSASEARTRPAVALLKVAIRM